MTVVRFLKMVLDVSPRLCLLAALVSCDAANTAVDEAAAGGGGAASGGGNGPVADANREMGAGAGGSMSEGGESNSSQDARADNTSSPSSSDANREPATASDSGGAAGNGGGPSDGGGGRPDGGGVPSDGGGVPSDGGGVPSDGGGRPADSGVDSGDGPVTASYRPCPSEGVCNVMPFGDSITDGYNADTPGGYRVELFRLAHAAGKRMTFVGSGNNGPDMVDGVAFPHAHEGHSGWTIAPAGGRSGISTLVASVMPKFKPHIVLLMIGTNDAIDNVDMANAPARLGALIDAIYAQLPAVMILVAQPIPSRGDAAKGDDAALSARIKAFDDAVPSVVKTRADAGKHIAVVDMYTPFNSNKTSLIEDQWHPNLAGYVLLGQRWYATLAPYL